MFPDQFNDVGITFVYVGLLSAGVQQPLSDSSNIINNNAFFISELYGVVVFLAFLDDGKFLVERIILIKSKSQIRHLFTVNGN